MFHFAERRHPEHAATISRVLAMPSKQFDTALVTYLTVTEVDALLAAPDTTTWTGRRDQVLMLLMVQTGLRISEVISLGRNDIHLGTGAHVTCHGKGRKDRITPLTKPTVNTLRQWLAESPEPQHSPVFPTRTGRPLSRDAIEHRLAHHHRTAAAACPSLATKHLTTHVLRHTAAMRLLEAGIDTTVIALWLGHERIDTTAVYLHAHLKIKEKALAATTPPRSTLASSLAHGQGSLGSWSIFSCRATSLISSGSRFRADDVPPLAAPALGPPRPRGRGAGTAGAGDRAPWPWPCSCTG
jgi:integrase/recombinase XerD